MFVLDDRQKSYHDGPKSWSHNQLLIGISLDRQMRDRQKSMCKSPIGVCLIGECLGTIFCWCLQGEESQSCQLFLSCCLWLVPKGRKNKEREDGFNMLLSATLTWRYFCLFLSLKQHASLPPIINLSLYFNSRCVELFGGPALDPMQQRYFSGHFVNYTS